MDLFKASTEAMRTEWGTCRLDDPVRAGEFEAHADQFYAPDTRSWYINLLRRAQQAGWAAS